jgi:hypothetical protein
MIDILEEKRMSNFLLLLSPLTKYVSVANNASHVTKTALSLDTKSNELIYCTTSTLLLMMNNDERGDKQKKMITVAAAVLAESSNGKHR